jgi:DNA-binding beta-propeller fold protein YncE
VAGATLFVADTGNHAVRAVDLESGEVTTVVAPDAQEGRPLRSPWGLAWDDDGNRLFIAAAGLHQIWIFDPATKQAGPFAGTGVEGGRDGEASEAWFAQPSGVALADGVLYVADSETSTIRAISHLDRGPRVRTVCGAGDLFGFGDRDGAGPAAELQHPLGVAGCAGTLYVADSFNHKIRAVDPATGRCRTLFGGGGPELDPGTTDAELSAARPGVPAFSEPEGIAALEGRLLVADTGNHRILEVDIADGRRRAIL